MKGIVFTEFLEMVEKNYGYAIVDTIIEKSQLPSQGIYTAIGTYHHSEIVSLLMELAQTVDEPPDVLLKAFGKYLFDTFLKGYPSFFSAVDHPFAFLESIDKHIHVEVLKLYPDALFPKFETIIDDQNMQMTYQSVRKMSALAEGLIEKTLEHYGYNQYTLSKKIIEKDGSVVLFDIKLFQ